MNKRPHFRLQPFEVVFCLHPQQALIIELLVELHQSKIRGHVVRVGLLLQLLNMKAYYPSNRMEHPMI